MVFAMSLMQELCVRVTKPQTATSHFFLDFDFRYFWQWSRFLDYVQGRGFEGSKYIFLTNLAMPNIIRNSIFCL